MGTYKSRVNGLGLSTSTTAAKSPATLVTNMGNLGSKVMPLKASNNPGPMTAPSSQGPVQTKARQASGVTSKV